MPSLLTSDEITSMQSAMRDLHDTYARDIVVYLTAKKTIVSTNPSHNYFYNSGPNQTAVTDVISKVVCKARIHYPKEGKLDSFLRAGGSKSDDQLQLIRKDYKVKLVVEEAIKDIIVKSERIEFDGTLLAVDSDYRPHGVIGVQFWDVYLIANN